MEENLKTIRTTHRALIIAAAVLLIYGLSIEPYVNSYEQALREFKEMDFCIDRVAELQDSIVSAYIGSLVGISQIEDFLDSNGVAAPDHGYEIVRIADDFGVNKLKSKTLPEVLAYFTSSESWRMDLPYLDADLVDMLRIDPFLKAMDSLIHKNDWSNETTSVDIELLDIYITVYDDSIKLTGIYGNHYTSLRANPRLEIQLNGSFYAVREGYDSISCGMDDLSFDLWEVRREAEGSSVHKENIDETGMVLSLLDAQSFMQQEATDSMVLSQNFSKLRKVYAAIQHEPYDFVPGLLLQKMEESDSNRKSYLEISGLKLPTEIAAFGGPLLIIFLFLDLLSHIAHLNKIKNNDLAAIRNFPWIGTINNRIGIWLTLVSVMVLIPLACILPLYKSNYKMSSIMVIGSIYAIVIESIALAIIIHLKKIRKACARQL